jgi:LacI family transcriptional regulator
MTIGHVIPLSGRSEMVNPIFADFLAGAGEVYAAKAMRSCCRWSAVRRPRARRRLPADGRERIGRRGHGAGSLKVEDPRIDAPEGARHALPRSRAHPRPEGYSWLDIANIRAFRKATEFLLDLGHRRIALINGQEVRFRAPPPRRLRGGADGARATSRGG